MLHDILVQLLAGSNSPATPTVGNDNHFKQCLFDMYSCFTVSSDDLKVQVQEKDKSIENLEDNVRHLETRSSKLQVTIAHLKDDNEQYKIHAEETIDHMKKEGATEEKAFAERLSKLQAKIDSSKNIAEQAHKDLEKAHQHETKALVECKRRYDAKISGLKLKLNGLIRRKKKWNIQYDRKNRPSKK